MRKKYINIGLISFILTFIGTCIACVVFLGIEDLNHLIWVIALIVNIIIPYKIPLISSLLLTVNVIITLFLFWSLGSKLQELKSQHKKLKSLLERPIAIRSAEWGLLDIEKNTRDVTERVQELLKPKKIRNRTYYVIEKVNNAILCPNGEDPASGIDTKQLHVNYIYTDEVTIDENVDLILPCKIKF